MTQTWHHDLRALSRFIADLIVSETAQLRPGGEGLPSPPWSEATLLDERGLGLDSLERLSVATALSRTLHLHESGLEDLLLVRRTFGEWVELAAQSLSHVDTHITFSTSGSTGTPQAHTHSHAELKREVDALRDVIGPCTRILAACPAHHIYGFLFSVLLPTRLGIEVIDIRSRTMQGVATLWRAGDVIVSHPAHWSLIATHVSHVPPRIVGLTSTAPCPDDVAHTLLARGLTRLVQIYGSSETAGIAYRESPADVFKLLPYWQRENESMLVRQTLANERKHYEAPDLLRWHDANHFNIEGRRDGAVQVAGTNVFPNRVRDILQSHPQVKAAVVRLMNAHEGTRLKAFIVAEERTETAALTSSLASWCRDRLSAPEQPKSFTFGRHLPVNALGKATDWVAERATAP